MESPLQKKPPGIKSALLTVANVIIEIIMQPPKFFLRLRDVTLYVLYVCMLFFPQLFFFFLVFCLFLLLLLLLFLGLLLRHMEVPRLGVESELKPPAYGLRQSHSNIRSEPRLRPTPQLTAMPDP